MVLTPSFPLLREHLSVRPCARSATSAQGTPQTSTCSWDFVPVAPLQLQRQDSVLILPKTSFGFFLRVRGQELPGGLIVKDLTLSSWPGSLPWYGFNPWPWNFCLLRAQPPKCPVLSILLYHFLLDSTCSWPNRIFIFLWLASLSMIISRSMHVAANGIISFFFLMAE